jgi:hypothetical protein
MLRRELLKAFAVSGAVAWIFGISKISNGTKKVCSCILCRDKYSDREQLVAITVCPSILNTPKNDDSLRTATVTVSGEYLNPSLSPQCFDTRKAILDKLIRVDSIKHLDAKCACGGSHILKANDLLIDGWLTDTCERPLAHVVYQKVIFSKTAEVPAFFPANLL